MAMTVRLWSYRDCVHAGSALAVAGGEVLPCPVTYWPGVGWDLRAASSDRLAVIPAGHPMAGIGQPVSERRLVDLPAALREYTGDDEADATLAGLLRAGLTH